MLTVNSPVWPFGGASPSLARCQRAGLGRFAVEQVARASMMPSSVVGTVGHDAELEHAHLRDQPLDFLDLFTREVLASPRPHRSWSAG